MLFRELAPISEDTWQEMDKRAKEVIKSYLSARASLRVLGPMGPDYNVISEGRLVGIQKKDGVDFGVYHVQPLVEARVEFEMDRWELNNIARGARDIDYGPLEEAAKELALFEEKAIFYGLEEGGIQGLKPKSFVELDFGSDGESILGAITQGVIELRKNYEKGKLDLIVGEDFYRLLYSKGGSYPLIKQVEDAIGGKVALSHLLEGGFLLPQDHEDLELTLARDYSIGYQAHSERMIRFFITLSFSFRVLDEGLVVSFK